MELDFGDAVLRVDLRVKGLQRYGVRWHLGPPQETDEADRVINGPPYTTQLGKADLTMDLMADKKVPLSVEWTDELGNPVVAPASVSATFTVDDPTIVALVDNGDGTAVAAATGVLGTANVHGEFAADGTTVTADLQIVVVAGLAERANIVAGAPEEVTP